jgi:carboxymethylenebutenolidase
MPNPPRVLTSTEQFAGDGVTLQAFIARPDTLKPRPAVVVIHEWWGVTDHIKDVAQRFAREGFVAIAPDLYSRQGHVVTKDAAQAAKLMQALSSQHVLKDLNATTRFLKSLPIVDTERIAVVGFCMGGTFSLMTAAHNSDSKASVVFYGQVPPTDSLKYLVAPVLYLHGSQDDWIVKAEAARLEQGLTQYGRPGQVVHYPDAGHAFFNDTRPEAHRPQEAQDAWQRTLAFLAQQLRLTSSSKGLAWT